MLESAPPGTLENWMQYYSREPFGEPWRRMSAGACATINEVRGIQAGIAGSKPEWLEPNDLVPGAHDEKQDAQTEAAVAALEVMEWDG